MKFTCTLEALAEEVKFAKIILVFAKSGYQIKSQKQIVSPEGKIQIRIEAATSLQKSRSDLENEFSNIEGCKLLELETNQPGSAQNTSSVTVDKNVLKKLGQLYPNIDKPVKAYAASLDEGSRSATLMAMGAKVGAGIYARDHSLGSPLAMPAALHRALTPALKVFSDVDTTDSSITLRQCPFCAKSVGETSACEFVTGFIQGFMDKSPATQGAKVAESSCGSSKNGKCTFSILIK